MKIDQVPKGLILYRDLLRQTLFVPNVYTRNKYISQIKKSFRENRSIDDQERIQTLINDGNKKLEGMKFFCVKTKCRATGNIFDEKRQEERREEKDKKVFVFKEGKVVDLKEQMDSIRKDVYKNWNGSNVDPDALARHQHLLRRQHFMEGPLKGYDKKGFR